MILELIVSTINPLPDSFTRVYKLPRFKDNIDEPTISNSAGPSITTSTPSSYLSLIIPFSNCIGPLLVNNLEPIAGETEESFHWTSMASTRVATSRA